MEDTEQGIEAGFVDEEDGLSLGRRVAPEGTAGRFLLSPLDGFAQVADVARVIQKAKGHTHHGDAASRPESSRKSCVSGPWCRMAGSHVSYAWVTRRGAPSDWTMPRGLPLYVTTAKVQNNFYYLLICTFCEENMRWCKAYYLELLQNEVFRRCLDGGVSRRAIA
jgi:hypothetical protein